MPETLPRRHSIPRNGSYIRFSTLRSLQGRQQGSKSLSSENKTNPDLRRCSDVDEHSSGGGALASVTDRELNSLRTRWLPTETLFLFFSSAVISLSPVLVRLRIYSRTPTSPPPPPPRLSPHSPPLSRLFILIRVTRVILIIKT